MNLKAKLEAQDYKCPYTGERLILGINASIDHIKPISRFADLAAELDNIEWVSSVVNQAKSNLTPEEFLNLVKTIATHRIGLR